MLDALGPSLMLLAVWTVAAVLLAWGFLPESWRRGLALLTSLSGLALLIVAMGTEGLRESSTVRDSLLATPVVSERTSASASLPYYVLTAVCLLLGTAGLATNERVARNLARHPLAMAIMVSLFVTALRFALEKVAAPRSWSYAVGVTWLIPVVGAFLAIRIVAEGQGFRRLVGALLVYAYAVRGAITALMLVATWLTLGSHYDITPQTMVRTLFTGETHEFVPGSFAQMLNLGVFPQLVLWPILTLVGGLLGAALVWLPMSLFRRRRVDVRPDAGVTAPDGEP